MRPGRSSRHRSSGNRDPYRTRDIDRPPRRPYGAPMWPTLLALVLGIALAGEAFAGDAVTLLQERRTRVPGKKPAVQHLALVKNTSSGSIRGLRVTVELHDSFGKLL